MTHPPFYFDPYAEGLAVCMGKTEAVVMELVWKHPQLTVKRALALTTANPKPAYTTLMTIFNRLVEKKLLTRSKDGRHFVYSPTIGKEQYLKDRLAIIRKTIDNKTGQG